VPSITQFSWQRHSTPGHLPTKFYEEPLVGIQDAPQTRPPDPETRCSEKIPEEAARRDAVLRRLREGGNSPPQETDLSGMNLRGEDLSGLNLSRCDFSGADLSQANLAKTNLSFSRLVGANMQQAQLDECEFLGADLSGANLNECSAKRTGFGGATLTGATLFHGNLEGASLSKAQLQSADFRTAKLNHARIRESNLADADLTQAELREADLSQSRLDRTVFRNADLRGSQFKGIMNFTESDWIGVDIRNVDFTGAYLVRRHIIDENYLSEFRSRNRMTRMIYLVWWITSDCGRSFGRWAGWVFIVGLLFAGVYPFVNIDYGDHETFLSPIYYSFVTLTTLGYGDVVPASSTAQMIAVVQVLLGYIALGGLLSIFANKMARRGD
jgi:uncharacterized protein YjbI with pentapeptide repeats